MTDEQKRIEARIKGLEAARVQLIEALEALVDEAAIQAEAALAVRFEFTDKGKAEVVVCPMGLTYGVQCVGFPHVFAQFLFQSDAEQFVKIFNGTVARRVEPPEMESGDGFESRPVPPTSKEAGL